jgi:hypothetical protein
VESEEECDVKFLNRFAALENLDDDDYYDYYDGDRESKMLRV